jgi:hypothetical protein
LFTGSSQRSRRRVSFKVIQGEITEIRESSSRRGFIHTEAKERFTAHGENLVHTEIRRSKRYYIRSDSQGDQAIKEGNAGEQD